MSEADTPTNGQELPKTTDFANNHWAAAELSVDPADLTIQQPEPASDLEEDWQTVDFPNAMSIDAIAQPIVEEVEVEADTQTAQPESSVPPESAPPESLVSLSLPEVNEIVTIMQELQQRNGYLLNRVTQLEVVLHECQVTLEAQASRTQEQEAVLAQHSEELTAADEHIARLMHELECSHQAAQRQQILVETITAQLENSQERVAQLERECTLTQQRYNEQTHALMQAENICRDLRSRLHRQQRYTLQFKAALEKCLDVSSPCHEAHSDLASAKAAANPAKVPTISTTPAVGDPAFLPKVDSIQPWSARPWLVDADLEGEATPNPADTGFSDWSAVDPESPESMEDSLLELPPAIAPLFQDLLASPSSDAAETESLSPNHPLWDQAALDSQAQLSISYNLKKKIEAAEAAKTTDPDLFPQATSPAATTEENEFSPAASSGESEPVSDLGSELEAIAPAYVIDWEEELPEELPEALLEPTQAESPTSMEAIAPDAEKSGASLTFGADVQEEEELWQDLAKLIDVSETVSIAQSRFQEAETASQSRSQSRKQSEAIAAPAESTNTASFTFSSSWPSPTLYPLRSHKKRASMAAVELPSFPHPRS